MKFDLNRICRIARGQGGGSGSSGGGGGHGVSPKTPREKVPGHEQQGRDDLDVQVAPTELDSGWQQFHESVGHFEVPPPKA